jgi:hypothetical protein
MADFPENEIKILDDDYVSEAFIKGVRAGFSRDSLLQLTSFNNIEPKVKREQLQRIARARQTIVRFFDDPNSKDRFNRLRAIMAEMSKRNFPGAEALLRELAGLPAVTFTFDFATAFNSSPVDFLLVEFVENPKPGKPPIKTTEPARLPAYAGPRPSEAPGERMVAWNEFLSKGAEHRFQMDLLQAEINVGRRKFGEAISLYEKLLAATAAGSPRHKFIAIRAAFAHLDLGDQLFRKQRVLGEPDRQAITDRYDRAVRLLQEKSVSPDNPLRRQVEAHASLQKAKLQNNLNVLGLWDAFVPNQRFTMLQQAASTQIQLANSSVQAFLNFLQQADAEKEKQMDVQFQRSEELVNLDILSRKRAISTLGIEKIDEQLGAIASQEEFLAVNTVLGNFKAIIEGATTGGEIGAVVSLAGVAGNLVNFFDQRQQLVNQRRMAQIERQIAQNQAAIVQLERRISELRIEFYGQKLAFLQNKRLNTDILYELATLNETRAERQFETAVFLAYLFERALTFNLGAADIRHIRFDYLDQPRGILDAVAALDNDFNLVGQELASVTLEKLDFFEETISLRESYPIQFNRFLQTGEMDFVYSLYQLSKTGPATHQCRLREVGVEVKGLLPPTGFRGTLTHNGRYLVRDKETTVRDPRVTRLIPTEAELAQALEEQRRQGSATAAVGGVLFYSLEPEAKELSQKTQFVSANPPSEITLDLFEGIGPTGLWHLEIREHGKLAISDILLHFAIVSRESDPLSLEPKVEALIRAYETELAEGDRLDKISAFSLRQNFPDAFFSLQTGQADLVLAQDDFPAGLSNLQFKSVVVQALDQKGKALPGVALEISRSDRAFKQARVTRADGFSEDLDAPPQTLPRDQRFPITGTWQIRLSSPAQFAQLGDLRFFFMYSFEEV